MVLKLRGYSAWIVSDNEALEEYAIQVEGKVISCYICSEEGMVRTPSPRHAIRVPH